MTNGMFNDIFVQAEIEYRRDRAIAETHPAPRAHRTRQHRHWPLTRTTTRPGGRAQALVE